MSTQPTNSIDSELEEILSAMYNCGHSDADALIPVGKERITAEALQAIKAKYVSRKEIEEAIGEDENSEKMWNDVALIVGMHRREEYINVIEQRNKLRQELRANLLPPTNTGDKYE